MSDTTKTYNRLDDLCDEMKRTIPKWPVTQVFPDVYYSAILMLIEEHETNAKVIRQLMAEVDRLKGQCPEPIPTLWGEA